MEWQRLETLKQKLQHDDDFGAVWTYFFDHFGENAAFIDAGKLAPAAMNEFIEPVIERTVGHILGREIMIIDLTLTEAPDQHFYHGPALTDAGLCVVMYFDDVKVGMISFTQGLGSGMMHYGRFTTLPVEGKQSVILPTNNQTGH